MTHDRSPANAHGERAIAWVSGRSQEFRSQSVAIADAAGFGAAFVDIVEEKRAGMRRAFMPLVEHPRAFLIRAIYDELAGNTSYDVFQQRMLAFANGGVSVSGRTQQETENGIFPPFVAIGFQHASICAELTVFRSEYERNLAAQLYGFRPSRYTTYAAPDATVPQPSTSAPSDRIAVWAEGVDDVTARFIARVCSDLPLPVDVVRASSDAAAILSAARVIVSASDDPGTAIALAAFGRPLCAASPGAAEYLNAVHTFDVWNVTDGIDALLRALGSSPPSLKCGPRQFEMRTNAVPVAQDNAPLVSIVVTVYDRLGHLKATLGRLQRQTYPNIEIIVVSNNGPRADEICAAFANVRYIHREVNSGVAGEPRNDGIAASRGEFVTALDDDDYFFDDHIETMVAACANGTDVVYSNFLIQVVDPRADGEYLLGYDIEVGNAITPFELMVTNRVGYMTIFARKAVYDRLGGYDNINVYGAGEVELWLRMSSHFAMAKSERPTTMYTIRKNWKGSLTATDHFKFATGYERMYELYPATDMPLIQEMRQKYVASLRASAAAPPRNPRYLVPERVVT